MLTFIAFIAGDDLFLHRWREESIVKVLIFSNFFLQSLPPPHPVFITRLSQLLLLLSSSWLSTYFSDITSSAWQSSVSSSSLYVNKNVVFSFLVVMKLFVKGIALYHLLARAVDKSPCVLFISWQTWWSYPCLVFVSISFISSIYSYLFYFLNNKFISFVVKYYSYTAIRLMHACFHHIFISLFVVPYLTLF